jgi:hypothetical protein
MNNTKLQTRRFYDLGMAVTTRRPPRVERGQNVTSIDDVQITCVRDRVSSEAAQIEKLQIM